MTQRKGAVIPQGTEPKLPARVEGPPVEVWDSRGSPQGWGHWQKQFWKAPLAYTLLEITPNATIEPRPQGWVASGQRTNREGAQPFRSADNWIKALLARPCPPEQDPVLSIPSPSHQETYTSLWPSSIGGQTEEARQTRVPQLEQKSHYRKLIMMKNKVMSQMKGWDKNLREATEQSGDKQPSRKRIQNNDSKDDPESQENNGENARSVYQRNKQQTKNKQRWIIH